MLDQRPKESDLRPNSKLLYFTPTIHICYLETTLKQMIGSRDPKFFFLSFDVISLVCFCWSPIKHGTSMPVFNGSPIRHVDLWWVMDQACQTLMCLWSGISQNRHVGLWSGMSVFDQPCRSTMRHVGLHWVSDGSPKGLQKYSDTKNIFVNWNKMEILF